MTSLAKHVKSIEKDLWAPVYWEPVTNTGERLTVGVVVRFGRQWTSHRLISNDVIECLFAKSADNVRHLIDFALADVKMAVEVSENAVAIEGFHVGEFHETNPTSVQEALRTAALMYCSLASLDRLDEPEESDVAQPEEATKRFLTGVREEVVRVRPDLLQYFGRTARLIPDGQLVKFGFCSMRSVIHFGVLHPVRQPSSVRDARGRLFELQQAKQIAGLQNAALIVATPSPHDVMLTEKQATGIRRNLAELEGEADKNEMRLLPVTSAAEGALRVIEIA